MWSAVAAIASLITALLAFILGILKLGDGEGRSGHQTSVVTGTVTSVVTGTVTVTVIGTPTVVTKPDP